jgi:hypothetical protein
MPSHLCRACLEPAPKKTAAVSMDHAHRLFYIASRLFLGRLSTLDLDLFSLWTQEFYHEFSDFLH